MPATTPRFFRPLIASTTFRVQILLLDALVLDGLLLEAGVVVAGLDTLRFPACFLGDGVTGAIARLVLACKNVVVSLFPVVVGKEDEKAAIDETTVIGGIRAPLFTVRWLLVSGILMSVA